MKQWSPAVDREGEKLRCHAGLDYFGVNDVTVGILKCDDSDSLQNKHQVGKTSIFLYFNIYFIDNPQYENNFQL